MANWKWPGLFIALLLAIAIMAVLYWLYVNVTNRVRHSSLLKLWLTLSFPILATLVPLGFARFMQDQMAVRGTALYVVNFLSILTSLLGGIIVVFATTNRIAETIIASPRIRPHGLNAQLIRIVSKLLGFTGAVTLILYGGQYLGIPIGTLLASAGIGGVAIALGSQDTVKDLFGTISLMADEPFRVGDRIIIDKYDGVVEDIGLRSTRLRLLTDHLVTLPNDQLSRSDVENVGRRKYIRRNAEIHIPLDTQPEKIERAVEIIREKLNNHEGMLPDYPPRVFLDGFGPGAFRIAFYYWYAPPNYWDFKAFGNKLNFEILRAFEADRIQFSMPFRHTYWKHDEEKGPFEVLLVDDQPK